MTIDLSPAMQKRIAREAKARGIPPKQLVEEAVKAYLKPQSKSALEVTASRRRLRELTQKYKKRNVDFDPAVHEAKRAAAKLYEDNLEFIELGSKRFAKSRRAETK